MISATFWPSSYQTENYKKRASVHFLSNNLAKAENDASDALKLRCTTVGFFIRGLIAENQNKLDQAVNFYEMCTGR